MSILLANGTEAPAVILGIDPGMNCGWAILDEAGQRIGSGVWKLGGDNSEGAGMRYLRLRVYVREVVEKAGVNVCAYEDVKRHTGTTAAHVYGGIIATVTQYLETQRIAYRGFGVGSIKKVATGRGDSNKAALITAANNRWGLNLEAMSVVRRVKGKDETVWIYPGGSDNEADSLWIAETQRRSLVGGMD